MDGQNFQNNNGQNDNLNGDFVSNSNGGTNDNQNYYGSYGQPQEPASSEQIVKEPFNTMNSNQNNNYQNGGAYQDPVYQSGSTYSDPVYQNGNSYQNNSYQNNSYQNNMYQNGANQNNTYQNSTYQNGSYQGNTYTNANNYGAPVVEEPKTPGASIAGLVFGIMAIPLDCCCASGLLFGIIGLILSIVGNKQHKSGAGTAGLVCSIIAIVIGFLFLAYMVLGGYAYIEDMM